MSKLRWAKWFWADWSNDTALNLCSIPARGLWMALLCVAAQGEPYGTVTIKGRVPTDDELFALVRPRRTRRRDFNLWLAELEKHGVVQRDLRSAIWSPRMSHFGAIAKARGLAARQMLKNKANRQRQQNLHEQKPGNGSDLLQQTGGFAEHRIQDVQEAESPLNPPVAKSRQRKKDSAWTTHANRGDN